MTVQMLASLNSIKLRQAWYRADPSWELHIVLLTARSSQCNLNRAKLAIRIFGSAMRVLRPESERNADDVSGQAQGRIETIINAQSVRPAESEAQTVSFAKISAHTADRAPKVSSQRHALSGIGLTCDDPFCDAQIGVISPLRASGYV